MSKFVIFNSQICYLLHNKFLPNFSNISLKFLNNTMVLIKWTSNGNSGTVILVLSSSVDCRHFQRISPKFCEKVGITAYVMPTHLMGPYHNGFSPWWILINFLVVTWQILCKSQTCNMEKKHSPGQPLCRKWCSPACIWRYQCLLR